jgi:hypothetical protein
LDSPPPESSPNFGDLLSQVLPMDDSREAEVNNGMPLQQRAPGSQLRNGSITVSRITFFETTVFQQKTTLVNAVNAVHTRKIGSKVTKLGDCLLWDDFLKLQK